MLGFFALKLKKCFVETSFQCPSAGSGVDIYLILTLAELFLHDLYLKLHLSILFYACLH